MIGEKLRLIGRGAGSSVWAYGEGEQCVVLKAVGTGGRAHRHLRNEWTMLKSLDHDHIVKALKYQENVTFAGTTMDRQSKQSNNILVLEYASGGSLLQFIQQNQLNLTTIKILFQQIVQAVQHLHQQKIAHRDLKLDNVLVFQQDGQTTLKISDFGFASHTQKPSNEYKGTPKGYMAPEIHYCFEHKDQFYQTDKTDIFALGVILFAMLMGKLPFEMANAINKLYQLIREGRQEEFWSFHTKAQKLELEEGYRMVEFKDLFMRMVSVNPEERPSCQQVLGDVWFK